MNALVWLAACHDPDVERISEIREDDPFPTCADPQARADAGPFERVELGAGWVFDPNYGTAQWNLQRGGRGVVVEDFDGDGHLDLLVPQVLERSHLLLGDGAGGFTEAADRLPALAEVQGPSGGAAADLEGDGDVDVFLYGQDSAAALLVNDGTGRFSGTAFPEWSVSIGGPPIGCGGSASWADIDGDGDLDLFWGRLGRSVGNAAVFCGHKLLRNDDGALVDISDQLPTTGPVVGDQEVDPTQMRVLASGFVQMDDDPELELHLVADAEMEDLGTTAGADVVLDRAGDHYVSWTESGLELVTAGMGLAIGDLNADGRADFAVPGVDELFVMSSAGGGHWVDETQKLGIGPSAGQHSGWGLEFEDLDYDGALDLPVLYGTFADPTQREPDEIYRQVPATGEFERVGAAWGFDDGMASRGLVLADLNEDGWLDAIKREMGGIVVLQLSRCGSAHAVQIALEQEGANQRAIGAEVVVTAGDLVTRRYIGAGSTSYQSSGPPVATVGLGDADAIDEIEVIWPDGGRSRADKVAADQRIVLVR